LGTRSYNFNHTEARFLLYFCTSRQRVSPKIDPNLCLYVDSIYAVGLYFSFFHVYSTFQVTDNVQIAIFFNILSGFSVILIFYLIRVLLNFYNLIYTLVKDLNMYLSMTRLLLNWEKIFISWHYYNHMSLKLKQSDVTSCT
jgi:hypothetical protein